MTRRPLTAAQYPSTTSNHKPPTETKERTEFHEATWLGSHRIRRARHRRDFGETPLELIEVRAPGFGMPKLEDGQTAAFGHLGLEVDDLEDAKAELTRRGVVLQGELETDDIHYIFTAPETTFGVTLHLMQHKNRQTGE
jgi:hypothetical protein